MREGLKSMQDNLLYFLVAVPLVCYAAPQRVELNTVAARYYTSE